MKLTNRQEEYAASIAVIGKSGRFPGAGNLAQFWRNLSAGIESIYFFTEDDLLAEGVDPELLHRPNYVKALGYLENADLFDAQFFGFTPHEARLIDPQHRVFLECAWEALEDAGYASDDPGMVGVYASSSMSRYMRNLWFNPEILNSSDPLQLLTGNDKDHIAMRVSYKLNLRGPSICVQSACSSSLVAVHLACRSLLTYECDIALAGGVSIGVPFKNGYLYQEGGIASPDGHCRAFDARANGTILGHGAGVVVLKRLFEAIEDGDNVQAIIRGSAVNNDGSNKVGYTAPSVDSQADVIRSALAVARVPSETITYVETHGTGTVLGDPIELTALSKAFRSGTGRKTPCAIGALKTNIGHLDAAAGVAGLIKTVLALEHKALPPSLNFETPNPQADFETSPFYVNTRLSEWNSEGTPRRAGVSSLGMGGTNVHLVLEEAPAGDPRKFDRKHHLLVFSARTQAALESSTGRIADHLRTCSNPSLSDVAHTLQAGRKAFLYRRAVVCESITDAIQQLSHANEERLANGRAEIRDRPVVFMFPGQGAQYPGMGTGLYRTEPVFREHADQCLELLRKNSGADLKPILYPDRPFTESDALQFAQTHITQLALFITEYALAKVWSHWGIVPEAMIGHSIGEYVAACLSGVMSLEDALAIVAKRGVLMQQTQLGTMLAVSSSAKQVEAFLNGKISVAAINAPASCVVSGDTVTIATLEAVLAKENISSQRLSTSHAFHSGMMDPIVGQFQREVAKIKLETPKIPYISNLTGGWATDKIATDPESWAQHLRNTVRFADGLNTLNASTERVYLEVGPGRSLSSFVKLSRQDRPAARVFSSLTRHNLYDYEGRSLLETLGRLWTVGVHVDWRRQYRTAEARRISLPTYPFERQRYFVEPTRAAQGQSVLLPKKLDIAAERRLPEDSLSLTTPALYSRTELSTSFVAPSNEIEHRILEVWGSVLGIEAIGVRDDFWELGGHSLLATQIVSRLKERFHIPLPLRVLFDIPTIEKLAEEVVRLQTESANSGILSQSWGSPGLRTTAIPLADRKGKLALSYGQERLWFINQLEPENISYNIPVAVRVKGSLDVGSLDRTLREIARRHESLRTRFVSVNGEPQQTIDAGIVVEVPVTELSHLPEPEREAEAQRLALKEVQQPFDLAQGPLFRAKMLRLASEDHVLVFSMHHIVSDAWSVGVLVREVSAIYNNFSTGQPSPLPELEIQYADFSAWQRDLLSGPLLEEQLGYWKQKLAGVEPLVLPTDRPRLMQQSQDGATAHFTVPLELTEALRLLGRKQGTTLYMVLLGAFQALLSRYSGQHDIAVGSPIAGRSRTETEALIGFFINTLVLRTDLSGQPDCVDLLQRVKETTLEAYAHQEVPFEKLVEVLLPQRDLIRTPLFQVMFVLQNVPWTALELGAAKMLLFEVDTGAAQFEISLILVETDTGIEVNVEYNTGLFEAASISRLIGHYQMLLSGIVAQPSQSIAGLPLLIESERKQVIEDWNQTLQEIPQGTVVEWFEKQVQRNPSAIAVSCDEERVTYQELNERANRLAHVLIGRGIGPEATVAICLERSVEMVVGILGILKAGAAYLPLDPDYPSPRVAFMLEDAEPRLLLTTAKIAMNLPEGVQRLLLDLPVTQQASMESRATNPEDCDRTAPLTLQSPVYVIYTSGSTGRPKGVVMIGRVLTNLLAYHHKVLGGGVGSRVAQFTSLSFDVSAQEILSALTSGKTLCVPREDVRRDPAEFVRWLEEHAVHELYAPNVMLEAVSEAAWRQGREMKSLTDVVQAGEALAPSDRMREWFEQSSGRRRLHNHYGPSETHVATAYKLPEDAAKWPVKISIGRPIGNLCTYVLDDEMQPVSAGVIGELFIGGDGLARGYLKRADLTAERFGPNPFSSAGGERLYRTGDLVRWQADGNLEYWGRMDHQVKIRGFRIELGEIEAALLEYEGVRQAVVIARENEAGDKRLVAYVVAAPRGETKGQAGLRISELREHLQARLPDYMVPSAYMTLENLPLNPNGKIDRKNLPQPDAETPEQVYVGPRHTTEEILCRLWQEVLRRERVGIHDNFFKIGGHSLLAAQVATRMRESFKVDIPLRRMFELPTIAQLGEVIDRAPQTAGVNGAQSHPLPAIKRVARKAVALPVDLH